eukprot:6923153-Prymnesium_polylepis.1
MLRVWPHELGRGAAERHDGGRTTDPHDTILSGLYQKKKVRSGKRKTREEITAPFEQQIKELTDLAKYWESRAMGGAEGDLIMWKAAAEELRVDAAR